MSKHIPVLVDAATPGTFKNYGHYLLYIFNKLGWLVWYATNRLITSRYVFMADNENPASWKHIAVSVCALF